jgi:hypothetical protein
VQQGPLALLEQRFQLPHLNMFRIAHHGRRLRFGPW